jgi:hypothetical protein
LIKPDAHIGFGERRCDFCDKVFLLTTTPRMYVYKIEISAKTTRYFCCYTHHKAGQDIREAEKTSNRKAFLKRKKQMRR